MKTTKYVTGIMSIIFTAMVVFQSCAAGLGNAMSNNGEMSGSGGIILALFMLTGGIVSINTRNEDGRGGSIACVIVYVIAFLIGTVTAGTVFKDLYIWSMWCFICAILHLISILFRKGN